MYLCTCQRDSLREGKELTRHLSSLSQLRRLPVITTQNRMGWQAVMRTVSTVTRVPGRLCVLWLAVDVLYLACVHDTAPLARRDNSTEGVNTSSNTSSGSGLRSPWSLPSQISAPPAALLPASSRLSRNDKQEDGNVNETYLIKTQSDSDENNSSNHTMSPQSKMGQVSNNKQAVSSPRAGHVRKEFPLALVVASATAAFSILLFFCLSYLWHTRQLDRRAQKLAIRMAAQANEDLKCTQCRPTPSYLPGSSHDSGSDSGGEDSRVLTCPTMAMDELNSLNEEEEEEEEGDDGSRRKPGGVGRTLGKKGGRGRGPRRSGSRSSRKWSGHSGQGRSSLVTDQEILSHFASRRHSTFFI